MCGNCFIKLLVSIILGAIFGILVGTGVAVISAPLLFGLILILSVLFLVLFISILIAPVDEKSNRCFCNSVSCLIFGIVLAIIFSVLALVLTVGVAAGLVLTGVFVALASAAFLLEIFSFGSLLSCLARKKCCD